MENLKFDYILVMKSKEDGKRQIAVYNGTFEEVYKIFKKLLSKKNYLLDLKRA